MWIIYTLYNVITEWWNRKKTDEKEAAKDPEPKTLVPDAKSSQPIVDLDNKPVVEDKKMK